MRLKTLLLVFLLLFGFVSFASLGWSEWYPGINHTHSTFSDGDRTPEMLMETAAKSGALFLIVTDHYEQIDKFGFEHYRNRFSAVPTIGSVAVPLVVIPGAEITTYWNGAASHILALGDLAFKDDELFDLQMKQGTQQDVLNRLDEMGLLSVAAHPMLVSLKYKEWYGGISNFQFDPGAIDGLCGIEFFNDETAEGYRRTLNWYLNLLRQGRVVFVTSGCDSHFSFDPQDPERWTRKTWVYSPELTPEALLGAIYDGQTYASNFGVRLENLNMIPSFSAYQSFNKETLPNIQFTVVFDSKTTSPKTIRIYRNGELIADSVQTYPKGIQKLEFSWADKEALKELGDEPLLYVIEVEGVLVTSPIMFSPSEELEPVIIEEEDVQVTAYTYRITGAEGTLFGPNPNCVNRIPCTTFEPEERVYVRVEVRGYDSSRPHKISIVDWYPGELVGIEDEWATGAMRDRLVQESTIPTGRKTFNFDTFCHEGLFLASQLGSRRITIHFDADYYTKKSTQTHTDLLFNKDPLKELLIRRGKR